jgi:amidase
MAGAKLQAVVTVNPRAHDEAAAHDESFAATGKLSGPLHGVPVLVKDQAETAGLRTTFGSILFDAYVPHSDATLVTKLRDAGAVILAKTAMCDFAAGWFSSSSLTGHTRNPYDPARESGGSSAGTAAGVAANFGLVGIGEDTGGSIRIPASFNNLFGLRVTTGLISRTGFSPLVHFQDTPGPIGRTVSDIATLLDSIVGYDPQDPFTVTASAAPVIGGYARALDTDVPLAAWRIGVLETGFGSDENPDAAPVNRAVRAAVAQLSELGVATTPELVIDDLADWIANTSVYLRQSKSDINDFLARRPDAPVSSFMEIYDSGQFHPLNDLFHGIAAGPSTTEGDAEYLRLRLNQDHFRRLVLNIFAVHRLDFLVYPTVQVLPPAFNEHRHRIPGRAASTHHSGRLHPRRPARGNGAARQSAGRDEDAAVRPRLGDLQTPPADTRSPAPASASWSCLRELMPSFGYTLRRCHSTVRGRVNPHGDSRGAAIRRSSAGRGQGEPPSISASTPTARTTRNPDAAAIQVLQQCRLAVPRFSPHDEGGS